MTLPTEPDTLTLAREEAHRARQALARMETQAALIRELGGKMPAEFWEAFGDAVTSVRLAERAVSRAMEKTK
jgi:hypothetical protein